MASASGETFAALYRVHADADAKLRRVAISTWSFHNSFDSTREKQVTAPTLAMLDFPQMIADRYHVHALEFVAPHFESTSAEYLKEVKAQLAKAHSRLVNIPVDIEEIHNGGGLSDPDESVRSKAIQGGMKWIDIAAELGGQSVRCDPGKMNPADLSTTAGSYKKLGQYGRSKGIRVIIENHEKVGREHPELLVDLFKRADGLVGALPDFGNFQDEPTRLRGLELLFPYASTVCHAKGLEFDAAGKEKQFDFGRCVEISKKAKYRGVYSVEFEGEGDQYDGVQKVVNELVALL